MSETDSEALRSSGQFDRLHERQRCARVVDEVLLTVWSQLTEEFGAGEVTRQVHKFVDGLHTKIRRLIGEGGEPCSTCREPGMKPSHEGSERCESGSVASGGHRTHCSCDCCW